MEGKIRCILQDVVTGEVEIKEYNNLICTVGKAAIARRLGLVGTYQNEGAITWCAVGTDATAPLASDTALGTELARKAVSDVSQSSNVITIRGFFTTAEAVGALKEVGFFGEEAAAGVGTGTLFEHAAIDITKTNTKTLTIELVFTIN